MRTHVDTLVIGAGHAGLAVSRLLAGVGRDHVVLDRGRVGERWRSERWDSLHLLTPNWMTRLPGWYYGGPDPEGFLPVSRFVRHLERYAESFDAPVLTGVTVRSLRSGGGGSYLVHTDHETFRARDVVVATGPHGAPNVPAWAADADVDVLAANAYRNPETLPSGGVLVVGASASGVQIADELSRAGRQVTLAVGSHTRVPRRYRGMDLFWWLEETGRLARTIDTFDDPEAARREPSLQLVGRGEPACRELSLDLGVLADRGVRLAGRLRSVRGTTADFAADLGPRLEAADRAMHRLLDSFDQHAERVGLSSELLPAERPSRVRAGVAPERLDLAAEGIRTIVLATGYRPAHEWVDVPVVRPDGAIEQERGVTPAPGLYVVGQRFQHRRDSGFIDGARHDAHAVVAHLTTGALPPVRVVTQPR
jgi:putative flavoprotein involved in K+ transport